MKAPPPAELLRHSGPMLLLDEVLEHDERRTVCAVDPDRSSLFCGDDGQVPSWVGLEYMAQCMAAHAGLLARGRGEPPPLGLFLGARRVRFAVHAFAPGQALRVSAEHHRGAQGLVAFDCRIEGPDGEALAEGRLQVYAPGPAERAAWELEDGDGGS